MGPQFKQNREAARDLFVALRELNKMSSCHPFGVAQTSGVPVSPAELLALYSQLNTEFFGGELSPCSIKWSRALTRAAGNIRVESKVITLSVPLLVDVWKDGASFEVCGVLCSSPQEALVEILKHEMIHLWLHERKLPCGHTHEFRLKAKQIGQPKTRHTIARPAPKVGWIYECAGCKATLHRRRKFGRRVACARCCKKLSGGQYDERFRLRGRRL